MPSPLALPDAATLAGAAAVAINASWPVLRSRERILALQVLSSLLFGLHYFLLGARTGAAMCLAGAAQGLAAVLLRGRAARLGAFGATLVAYEYLQKFLPYPFDSKQKADTSGSRPWEDPSRQRARNAMKLLMQMHDDFGSATPPSGYKPVAMA